MTRMAMAPSKMVMKLRNSALISVAVALLFAAASFALGQAASGPAFDVASIRASPPDASADTGSWSPPGIGRFSASHVPLTLLIQLAYNLDPKQIEGKPKGLDSRLWDVTAKPEEGVLLTREELRPRLQNLLQQRFHLATHRETRMVSGYGLVTLKSGAKLKPSEGKTFPNFRIEVTDGRIAGSNWSMAFLAAQLQRPAGLPVEDRTGLAGSYDLDLRFAPDLNEDSALPSLFKALEETLGLKLESRKIPVEVLVIDHVDPTPGEN